LPPDFYLMTLPGIRMKRTLSLLVMLAAPVSAIAETSLSLGTGFDYSTGKYGGSTSTDILYIPVTAKFEADDLSFKLTVPYISVTGAAGVVRGMGRIRPAVARGGATMMTTTTATTVSASGLGDITGSAGYKLYDKNAVAIDLVGKVKLGTANANKGLGTGKNDYSFQVGGYHVVGKTTYFATAGYRVVGKPAGLALNNVAYGTMGANRKLDDKLSMGLMLDAAQSASPAGAGPVEVTAYVTKKLRDTLKVQGSLLKGLSDGSPDWGIGAMITSTF
jgi:hypothetical protein